MHNFKQSRRPKLSFAQERLWFIDQYEEGTNAYNIPLSLQLHSDIDIDALQQSLKAIVQRHHILRTVFNRDEQTEEYYQQVLETDLEINQRNYITQENLDQQLIKDSNYIFKLDKEIPIKVWLYQSENTEQSERDNRKNKISKDKQHFDYILINIHHIAFDGWSADVFFRELNSYYNHYTQQKTLDLPALSIQYKDFAVWQRNYLTGSVLDKQLSYWRKQLLGFEPLAFPTDRPRPNQVDYSGQNLNFEIDVQQTEILKQIAKQQGVTLYTVLLSIFNILLFKYTNQEDIVIGTPIANRHYSQLENLIGFFVNSLVIRTKIEPSSKVDKLIQELHNHLIEAQSHQDIPFEKLVEELKIEKDTSRHPIFQIIFGVQSFGETKPELGRSKKGQEYPLYSFHSTQQPYSPAKFDLSFFINDSQEQLHCNLNYATSLFNESTIRRLARHYQHLVEQLTHCYQTKELGHRIIKDLQILTKEEYQQIVIDWNKTDADYPKNKTIHQLFEEQVKKTPNNIAVVYGKESLSYQELDHKANQLANSIKKYFHTQQKELTSNTIIPICINRSLEMIVGVLGILKSGAAYTPLDANYPVDRLQQMLTNAEAELILTRENLLKKFALLKEVKTVWCLNTDWDMVKKESTSKPDVSRMSSDLMYVVYTSGSTGKPKGAQLIHEGFVNLVYWYIKEYAMNETDKNLIFSSFSFDLTHKNIFASLLSGAELHLLENDLYDVEAIIQTIKKKKITRFNCTPSAFYPILDVAQKYRSTCIKSLRYIYLGGEPINSGKLKALLKLNENCQVVNTYGPTECTDLCNTHRVTREEIEKELIIPLGKTVPNVRLYVIDQQNNLVPTNVIGELLIGGLGVGKGYVRDEERTAERFINNPFATEEDKAKGYTRLYKTGDLVRWLPDGNLEYIGRNDFQVKIRGFRIELGEIENVLAQLKGIQQATVQVKEKETETGANKYLVAYYITEPQAQITQEEIIKHLSQTLPDYMVPSAFVKLESFPLTVNGKLDRKALPEPEFTSQDSYVAPRTELEKQLCTIWQEVLGVEKIGVTDDFFRVGGDSILAIRISYKVSKILEKYVPVAQIFQQKTITNILCHALDVNAICILPNNQEKPKLSFAQERLWFIDQYEEGTNAYNIPLSLQLHSGIDIDALQQSLKAIVQRHHILRTVFNRDEQTEEYYQQVLKTDLEINRRNYITQENLDQQLIKDSNYIFKLDKEIPIKVWLYRSENTEQSERNNRRNKISENKNHFNYLLINIHHIAFDGWSADVFFRELNSYYNHYTQQKTLDLPDLSIQYKDFAVWQRGYLTGEILGTQLNYWKEQLLGFETLELPTDKTRPSQIDHKGLNFKFNVDTQQTTILRKLAQQQGVTLYTILLSIFNVLLHKYTQQEDIIVGSPIANRHYIQLENLIGFFVNSLVLRTKIEPTQTIEELIRKIHSTLANAQTHQDLPFEKLVEELKVEKDTSRNPIFQVMFGVQSFGETKPELGHPKEEQGPPLYSFYNAQQQYTAAKFDLSFFINDSQEQLHCNLNYATSLFNESTIRRLARHYQHLVEQLTHCYQIKELNHRIIKDLQILTKEEYQQIVFDWNQTDADYPKNKTIHQLFEEQVKKTPNSIAIIYKDKKITFYELNCKANKLAHYLKRINIEGNKFIAISLEKSIDFVVSLLGILKSNAVYVPFDSAYPQERLQFMLEDMGASILITQSSIVRKFPNYKGRFLILNREQNKIEQESDRDLNEYACSDNLAYIIYTSGSTGHPKGVLCHHSGVINRFNWVWKNLPFVNNDVCCLQGSLFFVDAVWEIFGPLLKGIQLVIMPEESSRDITILFNNIKKYSITRLGIVPSLLKIMLQQYPKISRLLPKLRHLEVSGEPLPKNLAEQAVALLPNTSIYDRYGSTEYTSVIYKKLSTGITDNKPSLTIANVRIYILNKYQQPIPIGGIGELYIGGAGLARGYLNQPKLTAERFINNPFATEEDKAKGYTRLYKTGDLVRWLPDGNLEYIGRNDFQVKIRGFRIELGEIENVLAQLKGIQQATVQVKEKETETGANKYLVAYYITEPQAQITQEEIIKHLSQTLPDYMVPSAFVKLESFPLTVNGKLDRKALPEPEFTSQDSYVAPRTELEKQLCTIWQEVLGVEKIGITDDFFRVGGNSILAIRISYKVSKILEKHVPVAQIFQQKTITNILCHALDVNAICILPNNQEKPKLSFAQERLWFIDQYEEGTNAYNIPLSLQLHSGIDIDALQQSLKAIVQRHHILRTVFNRDEQTEEYYQQVLKTDLEINRRNYITQENLDQQLIKDSNYIFKLDKEIPIKVWLYRSENTEQSERNNRRNKISENKNHFNYLLINIHHIAFDGWSADVFFRELNSYYNHYTQQKTLDLPDLSIQYKDFAVWQRGYLTGEILGTQLNYWKEQLLGFETLELPTDKTRPSQIDHKGLNFKFNVDTQQTTILRKLAQQQGVTLYTILLSIFNVLLHKYTQQEDIIVGSPIANRHYIQLENLIGFFVNSLVLRTKIEPTQTIEELIRKIHSTLANAQTHQDLPFEKLVEELKVEKDTSRNPIFQVMFGVQSFGETKPELGHPKEEQGPPLYSFYNAQQQYTAAKFDLSFFINDSQEQLHCNLNYATSLFNESTIRRLARHYQHLVEQLTHCYQIKELNHRIIKDLQILTKEEYQQIVFDWNQTDADYPKNKTIHQLFEEQVKKTPNNIAVVFEDKRLTYKELNEKSNQLARYLRKQYRQLTQQKLKPDTLIALCLDRSCEMIIAILAVLKAGGAYVPIDPNYPGERTNYVLKDTNTYIVITKTHMRSQYQETPKDKHPQLIFLDSQQTKKEIIKLQKSNLKPSVQKTNLAYMIYTSGTTGNPRGVMIEHKDIYNRLCCLRDLYQVNVQDVAIHFRSYSFDGSIEETLLPIMFGAKIVIVPSKYRADLSILIELIALYHITTINLMPSLLQIFLPYLEAQPSLLKKCVSLKRVISGGEALTKGLIKDFFKRFDIPLFNTYGPTENTIDAIAYKYTRGKFSQYGDVVVIGKPISNTVVYVLNFYQQLTSIGVPGELYIGGAGVARGYLNQPKLTAERFINNPFATEEDKAKGYTRLYKTGDLVRWLPDGNLEYIGRNDFQVKIRGFRIELGEIENVLAQLKGIQQATVQVKEKETETGANKYLVAYYITEPQAQITQEEIIKHLSQTLPDYMVPSAFVKLESFPLTVNGKLDRKALPEPEFTSQDSYVAPRTELEKQLCTIWQEVLGVEKIGITDDFFRVGGDSILSILLSSKMRKAGLHCSIKDIFEQRNIKELSQLLSRQNDKRKRINVLTEQGILEGDFKLLPIQEWFFDKVTHKEIINPNHWNQNFLIKVPELDVNKLQHIVPALVEQHDTLRINYKEDKAGHYTQTYKTSINIPELKILDISKTENLEKLHQVLTDWQNKFDIMKGPLWQIGYIHGYKDKTARIYFALHHLIVDSVSWRILIEDIKSLYNQETLPSKTTSYRQWVNIVNEYATHYKEEQNYWAKIQHDQKDYSQYTQSETHETGFQLDREITKELINQANQAYHTEINDLLLTTFGYALNKWNKNKVNHITLEGHGREHLQEDIDLSKTVGWFTTAYPIRLEMQETLGQSIKYIKESLKEIPNKGLGYGAIKKYYQNKQGEVTLKELPLISFNYLGQFDSQEGLWQIAGEDSGESAAQNNQDSNIININGMIVNGKLGFSVVSKLSKQEIEELTNEFKKQLEQITKHCVDKVKNNQIEYTPSDYGIKISQELLDKLQQQAKESNNTIQAIYPANSLQQGFIYHALTQEQDDAYRVQVLFDYNNPLDIENYKQAWELAIQNYPILRVSFNWEEEIIQIIHNKGELNFTYHDLSKEVLTKAQKDTKIKQIQGEDRKQSFNLTKPTQLRLHLIKHGNQHYTVIKSEHHSISDGWSGPILLNKVHEFYKQLQQGIKPQVQEDQSYLKSQKYYQEHKQEVINYWNQQIQIIEQVNDLNTMLSKTVDLNSIKSIALAKEESLQITGELYQGLKQLTKNQGITLNTVIQFAWHKLIQTYTRDTQTIVGTTVSGRNIPIEGIENSVGLYINTLPLIINWEEQNQTTIGEQLNIIHQRMAGLNNYSYANLATLQQQGQRLFHSLLVFENYPIPERTEEAEGKSKQITINLEIRGAVEKLDYLFGLSAYEQDENLGISLKYAGEYLETDKALKILNQLKLILQQVLNVNNKVATISLLTEEEYQQIVCDYNQTDKEYPKDKTINQLFEEQVVRTPDNIAIVFEDKHLTYKELNDKSNQLARYLRKQYKQLTQQEFKSDTLIALCLDRSQEMIIAILGILKAGGAYVPIDPSYPKERINYLLRDTNVDIVITQAHLKQLLGNVIKQNKQIDVIAIDDKQTQEELERLQTSNLARISQVTNLAYVIYTSGTTGNPKGVMIEQEKLCNTIYTQVNYQSINSHSKILLVTAYVFDASVSPLFSGLVSGASLYITPSSNTIDLSLVNKCEITHLTMPATLINMVLESNITSLQTLVIGGDFVSGKIINKLINKNINVIYEYGVTEDSITTTYKEYSNRQGKNRGTNGPITVGKPIANKTIYVLDSNLILVPTGVIGELYIGGAGLARGYLNQPKLTAERFINNPFATEEDKAKGYTRLYKTGDLVRWLPDGNLEYIGRNDFQVKIRGFRIELGEIENVLAQLKGIQQATVQVKEKETETGANKYLVAYYITEPQAQITQEEIIKHLSQTLPDYMVPSAFVKLESFPLTVNGKLDRKALPEPEFTSQDSYVAPRTELEKQLCTIWQEVLGVEKIGITDDFFRVGGDSILSILLSSKMRKAGLHCSIKDIFEQRNIKELSQLLSRQNDKRKRINVLTEQGILEGDFKLLPIQEWFFDKVTHKEIINPNHWNQNFLIKVPELDVNKLQHIVPALVEQHDTLRINYKEDKAGHYTQTYKTSINIPELKILDISKTENLEKLHQVLTDWQNKFDIMKGPLWQIGYIHGYKDKTARIYFALHHLIVDSVSWRILIEDIKSLYNQETLPSKTTSYRQWVNIVNEYATHYKEEQNYWAKIQHDQKDYSQYTQSETHETGFQLDREITKELINQANQAYHTEINDLLLTTFGYALNKWNKNKVNHITLEGHGREHLQEDIDLSKTVGWFTTAYPIRLEMQETLGQSIKYIKESLKEIPNKGLGYGAIKKYYQNKQGEVTLKELPLISFNYLGQFDSQEGLWQIAGEDSGESAAQNNQDSNIININGMIVNGKLGFSVVSKLSKQEIEELTNEFKKQLEQITKHCVDKVKNNQIEYTPSDYGIKISQELLDKLQQQAKESNNTIQAIYPANSLQQGFIYHALTQEQDDAYRVQVLFDYNNPLDIENYKQAWELAIQNYPILRVSFNWEEEIIQIIHNKGELNFTYHDLSKEVLTKAQKDTKIKQIQGEDRKQSFNLTKPTQLRLHLIKHGNQHYTVIKSEHHSISDGWSGPILLNKVHEFYKQLQQGIKPQVQEDQSYLKSQKYYQEHKQEVINYWNQQIQIIEQVNDLNTMLSKTVDLNSIKSIALAKEESLQITGELYQGLKQLTKNQGITLNTVIQFAWHKLIQTYTRDTQTIVGTTVSGRNIPIEGIENSVGLYINTLPLIINWEEQNQTTIGEQLNIIHQRMAGLNNYSYANLATLQQQGQRLFHSLLVFENYPIPERTEEAEGKSKQITINLEGRGTIEKLDYLFGLSAYEQDENLGISLKYAGEYLETDKALKILNQLKLILQQVLNVNNKVATISLLTEEEYQQIVCDYNQTDKEYPKDKTINQLFEEQVVRTPDNIAIVFEDKHLTYKELNDKSNQLARYLRKQYKQLTQQEFKSDTLIALCLDRSQEMIIAILGILKAGGAYVPIDPSYPKERINYLLRDTNVDIVITQAHLKQLLGNVIKQNKQIDVIAIDDKQTQEELERLQTSNLARISQVTNLAYVIYTSGTTGNPKGVMIEQEKLCNTIYTQVNYQSINSHSKILLVTAYVFDASVSPLFSGLVSGASLYITPSSNTIDLSLVNKCEITHLTMPATLINMVLESNITSLQTLVIGGDFVSGKIINKLINKNINVIYEYGVTEDSITTTYKEYSNRQGKNRGTNGPITVGKPIANKTIYVLDSNLILVPTGVIGELYIGGAGLARGYLNQPKLTAERFINNPFATEEDKAKGYTRLYKTGDLVRWLPDGNLEYIGRNDFQVKIRGFRIELGEIENVLAQLKGIQQATVQVKEKETETGANKYLVAYYITEPQAQITQEEIIKHLSQTLPDYMVPSAFVKLESFPLTVNGKLDRKALPEPEFTSQDSYVAPRTELEKQLCTIWQEVLGVEKIGITDDFFRVGGNSILAIQLSFKINSTLNSDIRISDLFLLKNIELLSKTITLSEKGRELEI